MKSPSSKEQSKKRKGEKREKERKRINKNEITWAFQIYMLRKKGEN